ncbi:hypothetical protein PSP6_530078 [Paraburkholderia tropica]|nr:hypothetical protein PSP6_530078 [Paraburkholderia tropica]
MPKIPIILVDQFRIGMHEEHLWVRVEIGSHDGDFVMPPNIVLIGKKDDRRIERTYRLFKVSRYTQPILVAQ